MLYVLDGGGWLFVCCWLGNIVIVMYEWVFGECGFDYWLQLAYVFGYEDTIGSLLLLLFFTITIIDFNF